ncbi:MAG: hypothetical protein IPL53_15540 [Ignavibacteria bacterium]|nr:hypothetical protein [Ignavibacteria bacterium]
MKINFLLIAISVIFYLSGCSSSSETEERTESADEGSEAKTKTEYGESSVILNTAMSEQGNEMYSPDIDSTYLYWLDNDLIILDGSTKCNIFALNVLYRSGFKTPDENALARDLFDTANYKEILPVIGINEITKAGKGDLVVWYSHVIIFESVLEINDGEYAIAWWAGTRQQDNEDNIRNNVCYGKYRLDGEYVVRRPVKK